MRVEDIEHTQIVKNGLENFLLVERSLSQSNAGTLAEYIESHRENITRYGLREMAQGALFPPLAYAYKKDVVFLDIENCGLKNHDPIFMIAMSYLNHGIDTQILFARDFFEEKAILKYCLDKLKQVKESGHGAVLTWNGTSFDLPRLSLRLKCSGLAINGNGEDLKEYLGEDHIDLCGLVRRKKKELELPDCSLQTSTNLLLGYRREGDISGKRIPSAYREYVYGKDKDGKPVDEDKSVQEIERIIHHNVLDNLSMVAMMLYLSLKNPAKPKAINL
jgi:uncharacterized protein YprB with RNaseH-like and TPR domain